MASSANSNRHWPSMFKSKRCTSHHHQWQHDSLNFSSTPSSHRTPYPPASEERSCGEPKPRWNPRPEQIRILEAIFNSGTTNPSRDEIRKIRAQLQQYGLVGDANVFYWFQNRKSRSKHKLRHQTTLPSNSPNNKRLVSDTAFSDSPSSLPAPQPFFFQGSEADTVPVTQGFCFSELLSDVFQPPHNYQLQHNIGPSTTRLLLTEIMNHGPSDKPQHPPIIHNPTVTVPSPVPQIQDVGETAPAGPAGGTARCTVFINDVAFEVGVGPFNVRETFGDDVVLIDGSGQPVVTDEWGVTLQSLQHGAFYYLVRTLTPSYFPSHYVQ